MSIAPTTTSLEERIRRLEDREQIRTLVQRYGFVIDDRDLDGIGACFTETGGFGAADGSMGVSGRENVIEQFHGRFAVLGAANHFTHDHLVELDPHDPDRATGLVNAHAEVIRNGEPMISALRYTDQYVRENGVWCFQDRRISFYYYVEAARYAEQVAGGPDGTLRNFSNDPAVAANHPEGVASYAAYYAERPRPA